MATLSHLSQEERIGLGIAAAAHIALVAVLVLYDKSPPSTVPTPERMTVSLANEVSLQSTAPDPTAEPQASVAPELSPEPSPPEPAAEPEPQPQPQPQPQPREQARPEPRPEPKPEARPSPRPSPSARPSPTPTAKPSPSARPSPSPSPRPSARPSPSPSPTARATPSPRPTQTARSGGSRIGADFLEGASSGERTEARGSPASQAGPAAQASIVQAIARQLKPHWSAPQGVDAEKLVTVLSFELNRDGSLKNRPRVVDQSGITDSNRPQAALHAERAIRAVQLAAPFDLPDEYYDSWKSIRGARFDRSL